MEVTSLENTGQAYQLFMCGRRQCINA